VTNESSYQPIEHSLAIPSDVNALSQVHAFILDLLASTSYTEDERHEIMLAVQEGVTNAIHHGNNGTPERNVDIRLAIFDTHLEVTIRDQGLGFDFTCVQDPTRPHHRLRTNGRGIMFIENFMDEVCFQRFDQYHELRMVRFR